jgi:predicted nucleotide-binding protein (sugar kinase/HSP70/actin superfamily)
MVSGIGSFYRGVKALDEAEAAVNGASDIKIGIIGEVHVCNEDAINMNVVKKLQAMGAKVDRWLCLSGNLRLLAAEFMRMNGLAEYRRLARRYFPQRTGGHANENIVRLIRYASEGYDGVVMLKPFACNPETVIEPVVEKISADYGLPVLSVDIDESTLPTLFDTRLESFVDMIRMRKAGVCGMRLA